MSIFSLDEIITRFSLWKISGSDSISESESEQDDIITGPCDLKVCEILNLCVLAPAFARIDKGDSHMECAECTSILELWTYFKGTRVSSEEISVMFTCAFRAQNIESTSSLGLVYMLNQRDESFREKYKH